MGRVDSYGSRNETRIGTPVAVFPLLKEFPIQGPSLRSPLHRSSNCFSFTSICFMHFYMEYVNV
jgi:hypothetical protein